MGQSNKNQHRSRTYLPEALMDNKYRDSLLRKIFLLALCVLGAIVGCNRTPSTPSPVPKAELNAAPMTTPVQQSPGALPTPVSPPDKSSSPSSSREGLPRDGRIEVVDSSFQNLRVMTVALKMAEDDAAKTDNIQPRDARNFILRAINDGEAEEQAALYVASKTKNAEIRTYAAKVGQAHGKANEQLRKLAAKRGINTPSDPEGITRNKLDRLRGMTQGAELDRTFLQEFGIDAHADSIALFEQQASQGEDAELKKFAAQVLPKLRDHYSQAKDLQQKNVIKSSMLSM
jgi:putative membrane protein